MIQRTIQRITTAPLHPGFLGPGHQAAAVIDGRDFPRTDPFIILMDDRLDLPGGEPVGGPHPHAGFETLTFVLQGDGHEWRTGNLEVMTAGKGIVHTEEMSEPTAMRIFQLWMALPPDQRWAEPRWQLLRTEDAPVYRAPGAEVRVYSGTSHGLTSPLQNHTPFTLLDIHLQPHTTLPIDLPADQNGFLYSVNGSVEAGGRPITQDQAAWLDQPNSTGTSSITLHTGDHAARVLLYAGRPHGAPIVSHGPFIGDTQADIMRLYQEFRQGKMPHLNDLPEGRKVRYGVEV